jgi:hypothetical protein
MQALSPNRLHSRQPDGRLMRRHQYPNIFHNFPQFPEKCFSQATVSRGDFRLPCSLRRAGVVHCGQETRCLYGELVGRLSFSALQSGQNTLAHADSVCSFFLRKSQPGPALNKPISPAFAGRQRVVTEESDDRRHERQARLRTVGLGRSECEVLRQLPASMITQATLRRSFMIRPPSRIRVSAAAARLRSGGHRLRELRSPVPLYVCSR